MNEDTPFSLSDTPGVGMTHITGRGVCIVLYIYIDPPPCKIHSVLYDVSHREGCVDATADADGRVGVVR